MQKVSSSEKIIRQLYEITQSYDLGFENQITALLRMGLERFNLDIAILSKIENGEYLVKYCVVPEEVELTSGTMFDLNITYCHITCNANKPVAIENVGKNDKYASHPAYDAFGLESYIGIPIRVNGELYGTLNFSSANPYKRQFKTVDIDALQLMASWIEVEIIRRRQEKKLKELNRILEKQAYEDSLTLIPNRRALFKHINVDLNRISRSHEQAAIAMVDIDLFKRINDIYGHQTGDNVLIEVAKSLNTHKRDYDFLARFGGEEFLLWLPNCNLVEAKEVAERLRKNIEELTCCESKITISIGISSINSNRLTKNTQINIKETVDLLIFEADKALYEAKNAGRNCIKAFKK